MKECLNVDVRKRYALNIDRRAVWDLIGRVRTTEMKIRFYVCSETLWIKYLDTLGSLLRDILKAANLRIDITSSTFLSF